MYSEIGSSYDKNTADAKLIEDCNTPGVKFGRTGINTKNSASSEGVSDKSEGFLLSAFPNRTEWNSQMILPNGIDPHPYFRGISKEGWSKWSAGALKSDIPTRYGGTGLLIPASKSCKIYTAMAGKLFNALIFVQGTTSAGFGTFIISGYGSDGGTGRYHALNLNTSDTSSKITCTVGDGTYFIVKNNTDSPVKLVIEEFFNQGEITCSII